MVDLSRVKKYVAEWIDILGINYCTVGSHMAQLVWPPHLTEVDSGTCIPKQRKKVRNVLAGLRLK